MRRYLLLPILLVALALPATAQRMSVTTASDEARAHFELGRVAAYNVQGNQARDHFKAALEADPNFALAHLYLASYSPSEKRAAHLKKAQAQAQNLSEGERMMIDSFQASEEGDDDRELALIESIVEQYPEDPYVQMNLGWRYYTDERYDEAQAVAERILEANPDFAPVYNMLGYIALNQEKHDEAEAALKNYVRLASHHANPYDSLGELYLVMGRYDEAAKQFEKALERDPDFTTSERNLVRIEVEKVNQKFEDAVAQGDADALAALYTQNGMLLPPNQEPVRGREAIRDYWAGAFDGGLDNVDLTTMAIYGTGATVTELGTAEVRVGDDVVDESKYTVIWVKYGDTWMLHRDMWNSNRAAEPTSTAVANDD